MEVAPSIIRSAGLEGRVRALAAKKLGSREIAATLTAEGVKVGHSTVATFLREDTQDRREAAQNVAAAEAQTTVPLATQALRDALKVNQSLLRAAYKSATSVGLSDGEALAAASLPVFRFTSGLVSAARGLLAAGGGESDGQAQAVGLSLVQAILAEKRKRERLIDEAEDERT